MQVIAVNVLVQLKLRGKMMTTPQYITVSCAKCGLLLPANVAKKRSVSAGSSQSYNPNSGNISRTAYSRDAYVCKNCAASIDKTNGWWFIIALIPALLIILAAITDKNKIESLQPDMPVLQPDMPVKKITRANPLQDFSDKICVIREWNGVCSEYVTRK